MVNLFINLSLIYNKFSMDSEITLHLPKEISGLKLVFGDDKLLSLSISKKNLLGNLVSISKSNTKNEKIEETILQLKNYFSSITSFQSMLLAPVGTPFQKAVWSELSKIPLGEIRTYGEIAKKLNSSARAVGNACRKNPIQIIIPCHRVISAKGIGGYAGETDGKQIRIKHWLLSHEGVEV